MLKHQRNDVLDRTDTFMPVRALETNLSNSLLPSIQPRSYTWTSFPLPCCTSHRCDMGSLNTGLLLNNNISFDLIHLRKYRRNSRFARNLTALKARWVKSRFEYLSISQDDLQAAKISIIMCGRGKLCFGKQIFNIRWIRAWLVHCLIACLNNLQVFCQSAFFVISWKVHWCVLG